MLLYRRRATIHFEAPRPPRRDGRVLRTGKGRERSRAAASDKGGKQGLLSSVQPIHASESGLSKTKSVWT